MSARGWMDGYTPETPPPAPAARPAPAPRAATPPTWWKKGQKRIMVEALCCEECMHTKLRRREEYGAIAYWQCERCGHRQKDDKDAGGERAHLA